MSECTFKKIPTKASSLCPLWCGRNKRGTCSISHKSIQIMFLWSKSPFKHFPLCCFNKALVVLKIKSYWMVFFFLLGYMLSFCQGIFVYTKSFAKVFFCVRFKMLRDLSCWCHSPGPCSCVKLGEWLLWVCRDCALCWRAESQVWLGCHACLQW